MGSLLAMILPALLPAGIDAVKGIFGAASRKWLGLSVDEQIKLEGAAIERLKALAAVDSPGGTPSLWVVNLRASFRYIAALFSISAGTAMVFYVLSNSNAQDAAWLVPLGMDLIGIPFSFIFGERLYMGLKGTK